MFNHANVAAASKSDFDFTNSMHKVEEVEEDI